MESMESNELSNTFRRVIENACNPYLARTKYLKVKNTNKLAIRIPTANARKKRTVDGVFPTNEVLPSKSLPPEGVLDAVGVATMEVVTV
jgi:hypothetical protein